MSLILKDTGDLPISLDIYLTYCYRYFAKTKNKKTKKQKNKKTKKTKKQKTKKQKNKKQKTKNKKQKTKNKKQKTKQKNEKKKRRKEERRKRKNLHNHQDISLEWPQAPSTALHFLFHNKFIFLKKSSITRVRTTDLTSLHSTFY